MRPKKLLRPKSFKDKLFQAFILTSLGPLLLLAMIISFQTQTLMNVVQKEARKDLLLQTERNITSHVDAFRHSLGLFTENNAFQSAWYANNVSMFDRYLFFRDTFDPTVNYIRATNPAIDDILFFTNSTYSEQRMNIFTLSDMEKYQVNLKELAPNNNLWLELDEDTLGIFGGFPSASGFETFVLLTVNKKNFFPIFYAEDGRTLGAVFDGKQQLFPGESVQVLQKDQATIPNTNWTLFLSMAPLPATQTGILLLTISAILLALVIAYYFTQFFARNIGQEITYLKQRVSLALQKTAEQEPSFDQQDEFFEVSNEIGEMLEMVLRLQTENYQQQLETKDREYHAMINQINAHFLYNTLSAINWRAVMSDQVEISYAIQLLSKYYRTTLNRGKNEISLRDELDNVKTYIDLQLFLQPNRFGVFYDVDESLLSAPIIHLLLQPIVENAIEHGFDQDKADHKLILTIQREDHQHFSIKVADNGIGFDLAKLSEIFIHKTTGYGLRNVDQRIKFYFGPAYGLVFDSEEGFGTIVTITLPLIA
ncbi:sensor histidine kinase [Enterococcus sp. LJL98]